LTFSYLSSTASVLPVSSTGSTVCLLNKREEKKKTICLEIDRYLFKKIRESLWWWLAPFYIYLRHLHNKRRRNKTNGRFKVPNKVYCKKKIQQHLQVSYFGIAESLGINQLSSAYKVFDFDMNLFLNSKKKNGTRSAGIRHVELDRRCALAEIYTHTHTHEGFFFSPIHNSASIA
jgi:hypothetical protein